MIVIACICALLVLPVAAQPDSRSAFKQVCRDSAFVMPAGFTYETIHGADKSADTPGFFFANTGRIPFSYVDGKLAVQKVVLSNGRPIFLEKEVSAAKHLSDFSPEERFLNFFRALKSASGISDPESHFDSIRHYTDDLGIIHVHAIQRIHGIDIYGSEVSLHLHPDKEVFLGRLYPPVGVPDAQVVLNRDDALAVAVSDLKSNNVYCGLSKEEMLMLRYDAPGVKLVWFEPDKEAQRQTYALAYEIDIRPNAFDWWKYFVDAHSGHIWRSFNMTTYNGPVTATGNDLLGVPRTINAYLQDGTYYLHNRAEPMFNAQTTTGEIVIYDANNTSTSNMSFREVTSPNNTWDAKSVSAMYNATRTYRYMQETLNRSSFNNEGATIITYINIVNPDGSSMDNAFWNGVAIHFGNGHTDFDPIVAALDVVAHELGHAVTQFTANLEYYGQSGAVNETYSDIMGAMVERENWQIAESISRRSTFPSGAMRDMSDPHNGGTSTDHYWQPRHVSEMYIGQMDNGGVHINSGIGNYAYYLFATATSKEKAEQAFFRALTTYLKKTSQFIDFRISVVQSGKDLWGEGSVEVQELEKAFDAVGIHEQEQVNTEQDYPVNPGAEYLMSYDTNMSDPNTLYRSSTSGSNFVAYSNTPMKGKVSIVDDGSIGVFVASDSRIKAITLAPSNITESVLSNDAIWDNVAVSKDGRRIAAITTQADAAIYVYDFGLQRWAKFDLYNPTTSNDNTLGGGVLFADALEFDITGEYVLYDAYNILNSATNIDKYYWDIGIIRVWNNLEDTFGDGRIGKLFGTLPENVSIGNPVFAKNSPHIIAFDFLDEWSDEFYIMGVNVINGDLDVIVQSATIGFPAYSRLDNSMAFSALNMSGAEVVASIPLAANKISASGQASIIITDAKWPVHYATGQRPLGLAPVSNFTADIREGPAPVQVRFIDLSINNPASWSWLLPGASPSTSNLQNPVVNYYSPGTYAVTLNVTNSFGQHSNSQTAFIVVQETTSTGELVATSISFFPNPASDMLTIQCEDAFTLSIFDVHGRLMLQAKNVPFVDISTLNHGIYIIEIQTGNGRIVDKLIKQ